MTAPRPLPDLLPGDWAVLGVVAERPTHGYAVARELSPDGELGAIWALSRPLVYRAIQKLRDGGLIEPVGTQSGGGPRRELLGCTAAGRAAVERWLAEPIDHPRDARTLLMLKLAFLHRAGRDPAGLLRAQQERFEPVIAALGERARESVAFERTIARFRYETARGIARFIEAALAGD